MSYRLRATRIIAKKRLYELVISPGLYIALAISLLTGTLLISEFMDAISSSGFSPEISPLCSMITKTVSGIFGETFQVKLFAEGPYLFTFIISLLPVLVYLSVSSVFKFGFEKSAGAIELITYGPADGTSYSLGLFVTNVFLTILYMAVILLFFLISALINNLVLGPAFFFAFVLFFFLALAVFAYSILVSSFTENPASGITLFLVIFVLFLFLQMGTYGVVSGYVRNLSSLLSGILQWFSPVFYWSKALDFAEYGAFGGYFLNILALVVLSAGILFVSHILIKVKGVRE